MIKAAGLADKDTVLEIGPGKGALTKELLRSGAKVVAVEKDKELLPVLQEKFHAEIESAKLNLIVKDIREIDDKTLRDLGNYKLIANIPYYITGELLRRFLETDFKPERIILLVQKEVADRIVSQKESILSLSIKCFGHTEKIFNVSKSCFAPQPKVDSAIIKIDIKKQKFNKEEVSRFFGFIKLAFSQKRKKLINNLKREFDETVLKNCFAKLDIDVNFRPEDLNIDKYMQLINCLSND